MTRLTHPRARNFALMLALGFGAWFAGAAPARADVLDKHLLQQIPAVLDELHALKCKNVAVFNFQVQAGKADPSFFVGRLNTTLATRLENALILGYDSDRPLGVTRGAGEVAARRDKGATYRTAEGLQKLFAGEYPLAWGEKSVKVDALLTGLVTVSPDLAEATVALHLYTPGRAEPKVVAKFTAPTNRLLLADLGQGFLVRKRELTSVVPLESVDKAALGGVQLANDTEPKADEESFDRLLQFHALYDGKPAKRGPGLTLQGPRENQDVQFRLKANERLGVVLLVNGMNTLQEEADEREPDQYSMWVLEPGQEYIIKGYYTPKGRRPIRVLSESESVLAELGNPKRGKVELFVFREVPTKKSSEDPPEKLPGAVLRPITLRETARAGTPEELRDEVLRLSSAKRSRGLMVPDTQTQKTAPIQKVAFEGVLAGYRVLAYYEAPR